MKCMFAYKKGKKTYRFSQSNPGRVKETEGRGANKEVNRQRNFNEH